MQFFACGFMEMSHDKVRASLGTFEGPFIFGLFW